MTSTEPDHNQPPPHHSDAYPARLATDSSRQGPKGKRILYVLAGTVFGAIIVVGAIFLWFAARADLSRGHQSILSIETIKTTCWIT